MFGVIYVQTQATGRATPEGLFFPMPSETRLILMRNTALRSKSSVKCFQKRISKLSQKLVASGLVEV